MLAAPFLSFPQENGFSLGLLNGKIAGVYACGNHITTTREKRLGRGGEKEEESQCR